jgi:transposase, IS30 family
MSHIQFTRDSRVELAILLNAKKNQSQCAKILGMDRSNVSREIKNNKDFDGVYRGIHAHQRYLKRRKIAKAKERKIENNTKLRKYIVQKLKLFWSPQQIAGRLKKLNGKSVICHETIYTFVYEKRPDLIKYLRHQKSKYRKKRGSNARISLCKAMKIKRIEERPSVVETRERLGDWEGDTVVGKEKKQRVLTYVERKSGYALAEKLNTVTAEIVNEKTISLFKKLPKSKRLTLTRDNGPEFGDYDRTLENETDMEVYRANPYCSCERGTNENWNGLLRQFFPKGMYFDIITSYDVKKAVRLLNNRPRKRLSYLTPREVFKNVAIQIRT